MSGWLLEPAVLLQFYIFNMENYTSPTAYIPCEKILPGRLPISRTQPWRQL
jgi:hypothetical protein